MALRRRHGVPGHRRPGGADRSRLDFDLQGAVVDKDAIAERVARWIAEDRPIHFLWIDPAELDARPELVRTMSVRPPLTGGRIRLVERRRPKRRQKPPL